MPLMRPMSVPERMPRKTAIGHGIPRFVTKTPVITAANVITVPTERSMPPVMMTKVTPMARIPVTEVARKMP